MTHDLPPLEDGQDNQATTPNDPDRTQAYTPTPDSATRPYNPMETQAQSAIRLEQGSRQQRPREQRGSHVQPMGQKTTSHPATSKPRQQRPTQRRPVQPPYPQRKPRSSALYLPWWSMVMMLIVVLLASFLVVGGIYFLGGSTPVSTTQEPIVRIITAEPTLDNNAVTNPTELPATQIIVQSDENVVLELTGPTLAPVVFTATPQPITVGSAVVVAGVGDQELNVRDNAGVLTTSVIFRADEGTRFVVVDGPTQADGFTWWQIQDTTNASLIGWAVSNYLSVAPE
jgi:hypothetical protein